MLDTRQQPPIYIFYAHVVQECQDWTTLPLELHSFPTVEALATRATEADLRAMGEQPTLADSLVDTLHYYHSGAQAGKKLYL